MAARIALILWFTFCASIIVGIVIVGATGPSITAVNDIVPSYLNN